MTGKFKTGYSKRSDVQVTKM